MKARDYFELAARSLKIRRRSNRSTVIAMALGFALLIPVIASLIGVNVSMDKQLNKSPYLLYFETRMSDYRIETEDFGERNGASVRIRVSGSKHIDFVTDDNNLERAIVYEQYSLRDGFQGKTMDLSVDGSAFKPIAANGGGAYCVIDRAKSDCIFPRNLTENYPGGIFVEGAGGAFQGDGKGQVVVSERFLAANGLTAADAYGKMISIFNKGTLRLSEGDSVEAKGYLCYNYKVAGVIRSEVSELYTDGLMNCDLFFTDASVYDDNGRGVLKPYYYQYGKDEYDRYLKYDNWERKDELNREYMLLGWYPLSYNATFADTRVYAESSDFQRLSRDITRLNAELGAGTGLNYDYAEPTDFYTHYKLIYDLTNVVSLVLVIVAVVIGFSALLNMFCSISHSVKERGQYLTMLRAIGAKDDAIPRLYIGEAAILCSISGAITAVVGFLLSMAVKLIFDGMLARYKIDFGGIPWWVIVVTTLLTVLAVYAVCIIYSYLATRRLSKRKITEILNNE